MKVTINETTAKELGITLPEDVLKGASLVK